MLQNIALLSDKIAERERSLQDLKKARLDKCSIAARPDICALSVGPVPSSQRLHWKSPVNKIFPLCSIPPLLLPA